MHQWRKIFVIIGIITVLATVGVMWHIHQIPRSEISHWVSSTHSMKIEWSDWSLSPGTPSTVVTAFGSFQSTPTLNCPQSTFCNVPGHGPIYRGNASVGDQEFGIPVDKLNQVKSFLGGSHTSCSSAGNPGREAIGILCIDSSRHKFLFYGSN